jgi:hypothetical protein
MRDGTDGADAPSDDIWEYEEDEGPSGHPLIATIIGVVVILFSIQGYETPPGSGAEALGYMFGRTVGGAALIWTIAYFATVRHAGLGWKIGSFLIFLVVSSFATLMVMGQGNLAIRKDLSAFAEMKFGEGGNVTMPADAKDRGPVTQLFVEYLAGMTADSKAMEARLTALGFAKLSNPEALHADPKILSDCGKLAEGKIAVAESVASGKARIAGLGPKIDALDVPQQMRTGLHEGMAKANGAALLDRQHQLLDDMIGEQGVICTVLARRHWQPSGGQFLFTSRADLAAFQAHTARVAALSGEAQQLEATQLEQNRQSQQRLQAMLN